MRPNFGPVLLSIQHASLSIYLKFIARAMIFIVMNTLCIMLIAIPIRFALTGW